MYTDITLDSKINYIDVISVIYFHGNEMRR